MARVLFTSGRHGTPEAPGFLEALDLETAKATLAEARGHANVRFWSHPVFGDAPGRDPADALRLAAKPRRGRRSSSSC